ncbi:MAG: hypothetical protein U5K74_11825 [Gemmatimonadaceae bacterium]|nr:hypothetical protein [Gemmatimonadaceae bacterium]
MSTPGCRSLRWRGSASLPGVVGTPSRAAGVASRPNGVFAVQLALDAGCACAILR